MLLPFLVCGLPNVLPSLPETVVYEANLRAEGSDKAFIALTGRLETIKALGVNVVWLMPVQPVGKLRSAGGLGSPYATADYDAVNPEFGTPTDLQNLIAKAHRLKMAVIIDWVANHTAWDHPWIKTHPDWYTHDAAGKITIPAGTNWQDVADLNFDKPALREAMIDSMAGWIKRFGLDGFRCDTADFVPFDFWKAAVPRLRSASPRPILMLAEGFRADHYRAGFDLTYGWPFFDKLCDIYKGGKASTLPEAVAKEAKDTPAKARRLRFTTNHDKAAWEGTTLDFFKTQQGANTAFAITALYGGTPLIYEGQEVGWPKRIPIFDRSAIDWSSQPETRRWISAVIRLRNQNSAFQNGNLTDLSTDDTIVFHRRGGPDAGLVLANVRNHAVDVPVKPELKGEWREGITGRKIELKEQYRLAPYESLLLVRSFGRR